MKNLVLGIFFLLFVGTNVYGQQRYNDNERIKAMRVAFITNALQLTTEESQAFWPLYNEYEAKQRGIRKKYRSGKQMMLMDDAELEQQLSNNLTMEEELLQLKRTYIGRLKKVLPTRKIAMLQGAETKFKEEILKQIRQRQSNRQGKVNRN